MRTREKGTMKIGFVSPPVVGHLNPMTKLARKHLARSFMPTSDESLNVRNVAPASTPCPNSIICCGTRSSTNAGSLARKLSVRPAINGEPNIS